MEATKVKNRPFLLKMWTITKSEIKTQFNVSAFVMMFAALLISMLPILIEGKLEDGPGLDIQQQTWGQIARAYSTVVMWAIGLRLFSILRDKSTLDKNRVAYLTNHKSAVLFGKVVADALIFLVTILLVVISAPILLVYYNKGELIDGATSKIIIYVIGFLAFYMVIAMGMRLIDSKIRGKVKKGITMAIWLLFTAVAYIIASIVVGIKFEEYQSWFREFETIIAFIPILNITTPFLVLYDLTPLWSILPLVGYAVIGISIFWVPLSTSLKEYLAA
ncbi:MAG: hypothetical protein HRT99_02980 [Mycoplasmatales bacterium]|nr:hypothetical protein [Mycoplasmatales bacterium]